MNTEKTKEFIESNGIVAVKADKTDKFSEETKEINKLLVERGNQGKVIPFMAIYPAGGGQPILLDGLVSQQQVLEALKEAVPSSTTVDAAERTAMKPPR